MYIIFSLNGCPFSKEAESIIKQSNHNYQIIHIDNMNKTHFKNIIKNNTFPQIYENGVLIGGLSDFKKAKSLK